MNVDKLKELYNNLNVDYNRIQLYIKNCTELEDWYYKELIAMYELAANLPTETQEEECHGIHKFKYYTYEANEQLNSFISNLKEILKNEGNLNDYNYNSYNLIN
jgi:hypothetical protein